MKRLFHLSLITLLVCVTAIALADEKKDDAKKKKKPVPVPVYLGNSDIRNAVIHKSKFDELLKQGLTSKDSTGRTFNVVSFMMTFCERMVYEDEVGELMLTTDYLSEYCFDSKLKEYQLNALLERTKHGDTVYFEQIKLRATDSTKAGANGKPIRLIITER